MRPHDLPRGGRPLSLALRALALIALVWGVAYPMLLWSLRHALSAA